MNENIKEIVTETPQIEQNVSKILQSTANNLSQPMKKGTKKKNSRIRTRTAGDIDTSNKENKSGNELKNIINSELEINEIILEFTIFS